MTAFHLGDEPVVTRLNLKKELRFLRRDPLNPVLDLANDNEAICFHRDAGRYVQAFDFFVLSAERCLHNISVGTRYHRQVRPFLGGHRRLSPSQRRLSRHFSARAPLFRVDLMNLLLHGRILLDRTIAFSRLFLAGPQLPSFTSFAEHKRFFNKHSETFSHGHPLYARYLREHTPWFDMPVKAVRDKIVVHPGPPHFQFVTYPSNHDMSLLFVLDTRQPWAHYPEALSVRVSVRRLIENIRQFLEWYGEYVVRSLQDSGGSNRRLLTRALSRGSRAARCLEERSRRVAWPAPDRGR